MNNLVQRLRSGEWTRRGPEIVREDADQIEALEAEIERQLNNVDNLRYRIEADEELMRLALRVLNASIDVPVYGGHPAEEAVAAALRERLGEKP